MPLIVDDAQLLRMAAEPPRSAARLLDRASAYSPLLLLLVIVLPILAATCASFESAAAITGLKALSVRHATTIDELLIPGLERPDSAVKFLPPLSSWLTALVIPLFPLGAVAGVLATSAVSLSIGAWGTARWMRSAVGSGLALAVAVLLTTHSQWLLMATTEASDALLISCLVLTGWGLWGHWRRYHSMVSLPLLGAGLAWGAALLAGGVLSLIFLGIVGIWCSWTWLPARNPVAAPLETTFIDRRGHGWALAIVFATGAAVAGWWYAMMLDRFGWPFLFSGSGLSVSELHPTSMATRLDQVQEWLTRAVYLSGIGLFGVWRSARYLLTRDRTPTGQLLAFMLIWWSVSVAAVILLLIQPLELLVDMQRWQNFSVVPGTVLAAHGLTLMLQRQISTQAILGGVSVTVGSVIWALTLDWRVGLIIGGTLGIVLAASAPLAMGLRRTSLAWSESEIRRWIQGFAVLTVVGHAGLGADYWWNPPEDRLTYQSCRIRLAPLAPPNRISLIVSDANEASPQLEYLIRSLFPHSRTSLSVGWDPELTKVIVTESRHPQSRMLVVEWGRHELRLRADIGTGWQVTSVIDPAPYFGRRFACNLIEPIAPTLQPVPPL